MVSPILAWNATQDNVASAFNKFGVYGATCVRTLLTTAGDDTTDSTLQGGFKYICTFT